MPEVLKKSPKQRIDLLPFQILKATRGVFMVGNRQLSQNFPEKVYSLQLQRIWNNEGLTPQAPISMPGQVPYVWIK